MTATRSRRWMIHFTGAVLLLITVAGRPTLASDSPVTRHAVAASAAAFNRRELSGIWERSEHDGRGFDASAMKLGDEKPPLKPEWESEWRLTRKRADAGMKVWDPDIVCLPPGMPRTMNATYPFEVLITPGRITILTELFNEIRRVWLDGRPHPGADDLEPTFSGHSIGHWEGSTLSIDTVGLRSETVIDAAMVPHSDQMHVIESVRRVAPDELEWTVTLDDPVVFAQPWKTVKHFHRSPPGTEIREFICNDNNQPDRYLSSPDDSKYLKVDPRLKTLP